MKSIIIKIFCLDGHEGFFFEVQDIYSKYLRRPKILHDMCFSQFAKMYRTKGSDTEREESGEEIMESLETEGNHEDTFEKFNFVMTTDISSTKKQILPQNILPQSHLEDIPLLDF